MTPAPGTPPPTPGALSPAQRSALLTLAGLVVAGSLLALLADVLAPFLCAALLAYAVNPLVEALTKRSLPRALGSALAILLCGFAFLALILSVVPLVIELSGRIATRLPTLYNTVQTQLLPWLHQKFGLTLTLDLPHLSAFAQQHARELQTVLGKFLGSLGEGGKNLLNGLVFLIMVPVVTYFLLVDWQTLTARADELVPRRWHSMVRKLLGEIDVVLGHYLRGQLAVMFILAAFYSVALAVAGLDFALPVGILTGLLIFIPYLGFSLGLILAVVTALLQTGDSPLAWVVLIFATGQLLESFLLTPWLVGERIGLHPVAVIFALLAFGQLFGFVGLLLALPAAAALLVTLRALRERYLASEYYRQP